MVDVLSLSRRRGVECTSSAFSAVVADTNTRAVDPLVTLREALVLFANRDVALWFDGVGGVVSAQYRAALSHRWQRALSSRRGDDTVRCRMAASRARRLLADFRRRIDEDLVVVAATTTTH